MTSPDNVQKGFYDVKRQFQGKDEPAREAAVLSQPTSAPPMGQLVAGLIFLAVIALGFFKLAIPDKLEPVAPAPAAAAHNGK